MTVIYTIRVYSSMPLNRPKFEGPFVSLDSDTLSTRRAQAEVKHSRYGISTNIYKDACVPVQFAREAYSGGRPGLERLMTSCTVTRTRLFSKEITYSYTV
jgi:hypothetical protein